MGMKRTILVSILLGLFLVSSATTNAINKEWSAVLGFVGGVVVANSFDNHPVHRDIIIERQYRPYYAEYPTGHYELRTRQVWVPGEYQYVYGRHGRVQRVWASGYYRIERCRVWVEDSVVVERRFYY